MKLRNLRVEIFTGSDPTSLTNQDGQTLEEWIASFGDVGQPGGEDVFIEPIIVESVGSDVWVFIQYAEG